MTKEVATNNEKLLPRCKGISFDAGLVLFLITVLAACIIVHQAAESHFDFGVFYYAAHMVLQGSGHALYELSAQQAFQTQFHRPHSQLFYYPPYVLIPFLAIAKLPMLWAFALWTAFSLVLVVVSVRILAAHAGIAYGNWPTLLSVAFMPVALNLGHGQLSILVLAAYVFTYRLWQKGYLFSGGMILVFAAFKFQLVMGFVLILLLKRKWRELGGFAAGSIVMLLASILIAGIPSLITYPGFVRHSEGGIGSEPGNMANWRGILSVLGVEHVVWIVALSSLTVFYAVWAWKSLDRGFSAAVLAAMLVSYHFNPQDMSLSLLPFFLAAKTGILPVSRIPLVAFLMLLAPISVVAIGAPFAWLAIPLAAALVWVERTEPKVAGYSPDAGNEPL